jgi:hypothetical protein
VKVAVFEAPASELDRGESDGSFSNGSTKLPIYRFGSLPLREEKCHHASLLLVLDFDPRNVRFDFLMGQSVGNSTVAIEQRMGIQI